MSQAFTLERIAEFTGGEVVGDGQTVVTGFSAADEAGEGDLTFADNETFFQSAERSGASAILVSGEFSSARKPLVRVANARIAVASRASLGLIPPRLCTQRRKSARMHRSGRIRRWAAA